MAWPRANKYEHLFFLRITLSPSTKRTSPSSVTGHADARLTKIHEILTTIHVYAPSVSREKFRREDSKQRYNVRELESYIASNEMPEKFEQRRNWMRS